MRRRRVLATSLVLVLLAHGAAPSLARGKAEEFFRLDELSEAVALDGNHYYVPTIFGPTGMIGWIFGSYLVVREVAKGSPADGRVRKGDVLAEVNGKPLGDEPLRTLGVEINESEKTGTVALGVLRCGRKLRVSLRLRKLGAFAKDWPCRCEKSTRVLLGACRYLEKIQNFDGGFDSTIHVGFAMNGMLFLASDEPRYLDNARRIASHYRRHNDLAATGGTTVWGWGYMGVFLAEYYLRTGDATVLDLCRAVARTLAKWQQASGTWGHGPMPNLGYVRGGSLNNAALPAWMALMLIQECGVDVDERALARAHHFFSRFIDHGGIPYGDHRSEYYFSGNGKDAMASVAFAVKGDRRAAEVFARQVTDGYRDRHRGHTGGFMGFTWGNVAGANNPHHPDYRRMLDHWAWLFDVSRTWDGGFLLPESVTGIIYTYRGPVLHTGAVARVYAVPRKNLRIFGAPRSVFGRQDLPAALRKGIELYQNLDFAKLKAAVKPDSAFARQLLRAAHTKKQDIELSLTKAENALKTGNPVLAKHVLESLDAMCRGKESRAKTLLKEAASDAHASVFKAQKLYERYKWLTATYPKSRQVFEGLARGPGTGVYRKLARDELATDVDSAKWAPYCEPMFEKYGSGWQKDDLRRYGMLRVASLKGGNWPRLVAGKQLREAGILTDDFVKQWTALVPASGIQGGRPAPKWRYHPLPNAAAALPPGWAAPGFDDSRWKEGPGPVTNDRKAPLAIPRGTRWHYIRIRFRAEATGFKAWRLYFKYPRRRGKAVAYLNGHPVAWLEGTAPAYHALDLRPEAMKFLKRGENLLAVRAQRAELDIGLYAKAK